MISGRSFAELCRWVFDPRYPNAQRYSHVASNGDRIFLNGDYVFELAKSLPRIPLKRYVFVVHNSDQPFDQAKFQALMPFTIHIYAVNNIVAHPKVTTIPLGFADKQLAWASSLVPLVRPRDILAYVNFLPHTNASKRNECLDAIRDDPRMTLRSNLTNEEYRTDLCRSEFVLCPEGTGADTHRFYEALLCGATPVVLRNSLSSFYSQYPVCIVDAWTDPYTHPPSKPVQFQAASYIR
jgi:hypothetical protein